MDTPYGLVEFNPDNFTSYIAHKTDTFLSNIKAKPQITYLCNYIDYFIKDTNKKIYFIYENEYIDKHYMEDYSSYYVRCFKEYKKTSSRLHFFYTDMDYDSSKKELSKALNGEMNNLMKNEQYLGYIVIRPIPETFLAKICLKPYYLDKDRKRKYIITKRYSVSLFGIKLSIDSIAFQEQDKVVSACATTSIWSFLHAHPKKNLSDLPSPNLITKGGYSKNDGVEREFPNSGLSIGMICSSLNINGLSPENYSFIENSENIIERKEQKRFELFKEYIHAYCSSGLPLILGVMVKDASTNQQKGLHAVTILGYSIDKKVQSQFSSHGLDKIYVHDDRLGPFLKVVLKDETYEVELEINNTVSQLSTPRKEIYIPDTLIIGLYHKIRIPYLNIKNTVIDLMKLFIKYLKEIEEEEIASVISQFKWDIQIKENVNLKESILKNQKIKNKEEYLVKSLPKYMWSATAIMDDLELFEMLFDATDVEQGDVFLGFVSLEGEVSDFIIDYISKYCKEKYDFSPSDNTANSSFLGILRASREKESSSNILKTLFGYLNIPKRIKEQEIENDTIINQCEVRLSKRPTPIEFKLDSELPSCWKYYIWVVDQDGCLCIGKELSIKPLGHPTLTDGMPARIGGQLIYNKEKNEWEVDFISGRYSSDYTYEEKIEYLTNVITYKFNVYFPESIFMISKSCYTDCQ